LKLLKIIENLNFENILSKPTYDGLVKTQKNVTPAPIFIGINSSRSPELFEFTGFPFSRLRAEALWRASTGMTIMGQIGFFTSSLHIES